MTTYSVTLQDNDGMVSSITLNGTSYQMTDFPIDVNGGESLVIDMLCYTMCWVTVTMGGVQVGNSYTTSIPSVNADIVITVIQNSDEPD